MKTARNRRGCINNPDLAYQAEPREVKLRKIISGESNNMEDGVFPTIYTEKKDYRDWERRKNRSPKELKQSYKALPKLKEGGCFRPPSFNPHKYM